MDCPLLKTIIEHIIIINPCQIHLKLSINKILYIASISAHLVQTKSLLKSKTNNRSKQNKLNNQSQIRLNNPV